MNNAWDSSANEGLERNDTSREFCLTLGDNLEFAVVFVRVAGFVQTASLTTSDRATSGP